MKSFSNQGFGLMLLRLALGGMFVYHGITKLQNMEGTIGFFASLGFPAFLAWLVAIVETVGGILLILGLWPMIAGLLLAIIMIVAILKTKLGGTFGAAEKDVLFLVSALTIAFSGAGSCSLVKCLKDCKHKDAPVTSGPQQNPPSSI